MYAKNQGTDFERKKYQNFFVNMVVTISHEKRNYFF